METAQKFGSIWGQQDRGHVRFRGTWPLAKLRVFDLSLIVVSSWQGSRVGQQSLSGDGATQCLVDRRQEEGKKRREVADPGSCK